MRWTVDRIESDCFVLEGEDLSMSTLSLASLPAGAREGDVLIAGPDGALQVDQAATQQTKGELEARLRALFERREK